MTKHTQYPAHQCENWQMQESAEGGTYCAACGKGAGNE